jgi:hypothetical protein
MRNRTPPGRLVYDEFGFIIDVVEKKKNKKVESEIQSRVADLFIAAGFFVLRINSGAKKLDSRFFFAYTIPETNSHSGIPDLIAFRKNVAIFMEIKKPKGKLSDNQKATHELLEKYFNTVYTIRSASEAEALISRLEF